MPPVPTPIQDWDQGGTWDSGLQWDVNLGPSLGDITPYLNLVTSEHASKPNFISLLALLLQPVADITAQIAAIPGLFDVEVAVGVQLDIIGLWVGVSRYVSIPYSVYFSFDTVGLGFDEGIWWDAYNPTTALYRLPDDMYRLLIYARIAANQWNGTIPGAYAAYQQLFGSLGFTVLIQDNDNMSMDIALVGGAPNAVVLALFENGYLDLKPAGVRINYYMTPTVPDVPLFGFDVENAEVSGFDVGAWAALTPGS